MSGHNDLVGKKYGRLTVIRREENSSDGHAKWLCKCDCGNFIITRGTSLRCGIVKSCGCLQKDKLRKQNKANKKYNIYNLHSSYGIGYASNTDEKFYFDLEDYEKIKDYCWSVNDDGYMYSKIDDKYVLMHRFIINEKDSEIEVDHFNRNRKDNRKSNLKSVTRQHNNWNKGLQINNTSGITGITWNKKSQKWIAYIMRKHLGSFNNFEDAVKARKQAEEKHFGEYSYNNFNEKNSKGGE